MPRFKPKGVLERSALADLWKNTLSRIPSTYGRLTYLASLRDANSGVYRHHGLASLFGRDQSAQALRKSHELAFQEWLELDLEGKSADLKGYIAELEDPPGVVLQHLAHSAPSEFQLPDNAGAAERRLFQRDFRTAVELLTRELAAGWSGRASSPPA